MGGYYKAPFHRERGVTQGNPLLPTIFNVVVETVVCHWEYLLVTELERGEIGAVTKETGQRRQGGRSGNGMTVNNVWRRDTNV